MTAFSSPICLDCENFRGTRDDAWGLYCARHPEPPGIPKPVAFGATRVCNAYRRAGMELGAASESAFGLSG